MYAQCWIGFPDVKTCDDVYDALDKYGQLPYISRTGAKKVLNFSPCTRQIDCIEFLKGTCKFAVSVSYPCGVRVLDKLCPFRHHPSVLADPMAICKFWATGKPCDVPACKFAHPSAELILDVAKAGTDASTSSSASTGYTPDVHVEAPTAIRCHNGWNCCNPDCFRTHPQGRAIDGFEQAILPFAMKRRSWAVAEFNEVFENFRSGIASLHPVIVSLVPCDKLYLCHAI